MRRERYGFETRTSRSPADVEAKLREALAAEGFGVLTEIDVAETLREKLNVERAPYRILGACNPELANRALEAEIGVGLLLPCNVVVYEDGEDTVVAALDPETMVDLTANASLVPIAAEARQRLERVVAAVSDAG